MNDTNRAANRITLALIGLLLLAAGGAAVLVMVWPTATELWSQWGPTSRQWLLDQVEATRIDGSTANGVGVIAVAALLAAVIVLVLCLTRLAGRRAGAVVRSGGHDGAEGRVVVTEAFASDALQRALQTRGHVLFSAVSAHDIRRRPVLHVSVSPRQNTSPRAVVDDVTTLVANLAALTGDDLPTLISVRSGLRTRLAGDQRRLT